MTEEKTKVAARGDEEKPLRDFVAEQFKAKRTGKGWNMSELASRLGCHIATVVRIEKAHTAPRLGLLLKACRVFRCEIGELVGAPWDFPGEDEVREGGE